MQQFRSDHTPPSYPKMLASGNQNASPTVIKVIKNRLNRVQLAQESNLLNLSEKQQKWIANIKLQTQLGYTVTTKSHQFLQEQFNKAQKLIKEATK